MTPWGRISVNLRLGVPGHALAILVLCGLVLHICHSWLIRVYFRGAIGCFCSPPPPNWQLAFPIIIEYGIVPPPPLGITCSFCPPLVFTAIKGLLISPCRYAFAPSWAKSWTKPWLYTHPHHACLEAFLWTGCSTVLRRSSWSKRRGRGEGTEGTTLQHLDLGKKWALFSSPLFSLFIESRFVFAPLHCTCTHKGVSNVH